MVRPLLSGDLEPLVSMMSNPEVMRGTGFREPQPRARVVELLESWHQPVSQPFGQWAVVSTTDHALLGWVMLKHRDSEHPELGFMFAQRIWSRGYATEVAQAMVTHAFTSLECPRLVATVHYQNAASIRVLEKVGFIRQGADREILQYVALP